MRLFSIDKNNKNKNRKWSVNLHIKDLTFSITIPLHWDLYMDGLGFKSNRADKYYDPEYIVRFITPFIWFEYSHKNYNKISHYIVWENNNNGESYNRFVAILKQWANKTTKGQPPFSFNYEVHMYNSNTYVFYITAPTGWFAEHDLQIIENTCYKGYLKQMGKTKSVFPKYNKDKTTINKI